MMQLRTIARPRVFRIVLVAIICIVVAIIWMIGPYVWNMAVVMGMRPWNMRAHTRAEIIALADREPLRQHGQLYGEHAAVATIFSKGGGIDDGSEPAYLVFDRDGFLLRQHACFESMPGFLDSTRRVRGWYEKDTMFTLHDCTRVLRSLGSMKPFELDTASKPDYTVILGWNDYFRHAERKIDSFLVAIRTKPYTTRVLMVNTNAKDSSFITK